MELKSTPKGLTLLFPLEDQVRSLRVDFTTQSLLFRIKRAQHQGDPILKAFGLKPHTAVTIVDATAGLGQDAFLLAAMGHQITLFEKHDAIFQLLQDGLLRAQAVPALAPIVNRMHLQAGDACEQFMLLDPKPDYIYLDPMFPEKKKSALSKQSMEILKHIADLSEQPELLTLARQTALKRVVVKRPRHAPCLNNQKPSFEQVYKSCRFDVYVTIPPA